MSECVMMRLDVERSTPVVYAYLTALSMDSKVYEQQVVGRFQRWILF